MPRSKKPTKKQILEDIEAAKDLANFLGMSNPTIQRYEFIKPIKRRRKK